MFDRGEYPHGRGLGIVRSTKRLAATTVRSLWFQPIHSLALLRATAVVLCIVSILRFGKANEGRPRSRINRAAFRALSTGSDNTSCFGGGIDWADEVCADGSWIRGIQTGRDCALSLLVIYE